MYKRLLLDRLTYPFSSWLGAALSWLLPQDHGFCTKIPAQSISFQVDDNPILGELW
jgi:hypothetical protein